MDTFLVIGGIILAVLAVLFFMGSSIGMGLLHGLTAKTILTAIYAKSESMPNKPFHEIYWSVAQFRNEKSSYLGKTNYLTILENAGCFNESPLMKPEVFAETVANCEDMLKKRQASSL